MKGYRHVHHNRLTKKSIRSVTRGKESFPLVLIHRFLLRFTPGPHKIQPLHCLCVSTAKGKKKKKTTLLSSRLRIQQQLALNQQIQRCPSSAPRLFITGTRWNEYSTQVPVSSLHVIQACGSLTLRIIQLPVPASPLWWMSFLISQSS